MGREVEAKFLISDRPALDRLLAIPDLAGYTVGDTTTRQLTDCYWDTPGRALQRAGYACRLRSDGTGRLLTLKGLESTRDGIFQRDEFETALNPAVKLRKVRTWPADQARALAEPIVGKRPLVRLFCLDQIRHTRLLQADDRPVAELSLDEAWFDLAQPALELEVELLPGGTLDDLYRLAAVLRDEWQLQPASQSKFERGLAAAAGGRKHAPIRPDDPMSEAGRKTLRLHFERILAHEPGTRLGTDIEELHDMRVATRRMRAAFGIFEPYFDPAAIKPFLQGLRRTGRALGPVRDLDVFEENARRYLRTLPAGEAGALGGLLAAWQAEREQARTVMLAYLDSKGYGRFLWRFDRFLATPGKGALPAPHDSPDSWQVQHMAPALIGTRYEAVRAYEPRLASADIATLHALRIDFKLLRYALEFFVPVLGPEAGKVINAVKRIQDHLGELHDADVAVHLLQDFLAREPGDTNGLLAYLQDRQQERQRLLETFPAAWANFDGEAVRRITA